MSCPANSRLSPTSRSAAWSSERAEEEEEEGEEEGEDDEEFCLFFLSSSSFSSSSRRAASTRRPITVVAAAFSSFFSSFLSLLLCAIIGVRNSSMSARSFSRAAIALLSLPPGRLDAPGAKPPSHWSKSSCASWQRSGVSLAGSKPRMTSRAISKVSDLHASTPEIDLLLSEFFSSLPPPPLSSHHLLRCLSTVSASRGTIAATARGPSAGAIVLRSAR